MAFVDSNVLLDILTDDPKWRPWSLAAVEAARINDPLLINEAVYAEISIGALQQEIVGDFLRDGQIEVASASRPALFLAGKVFTRYRRAGGAKTNVLPDFFIGAQALVEGAPLLTRDARRYRTYFPQLELIAP